MTDFLPISDLEAQPTVYRLYDSRKALLYVGASRHVTGRLRAHRKQRWWWQVAFVRLEQFAEVGEMFDAEALAIRVLRPRFNVAGQPPEVQPQSLGLTAEEQREADEIWDICNRIQEEMKTPEQREDEEIEEALYRERGYTSW